MVCASTLWSQVHPHNEQNHFPLGSSRPASGRAHGCSCGRGCFGAPGTSLLGWTEGTPAQR
eukprot:577777-Prorocentrum_lima.AAC.1